MRAEGTPRGRDRPVRIGCCGWSYPEWVGPLYRSTEKMFSQYARVFDTVEIDSSFYRVPDRRTVEGLARAAPPGFVFTAKMPQALTHEARLRPGVGLDSTLDQYVRAIEPLRVAGKLSLVLVQLPPSFAFDARADLERFLHRLRDLGLPAATEFRHPSWLEEGHAEVALDLLRRAGSRYTIVDEPLLPPVLHTTGPEAYIRLHGQNPGVWYDYEYTPAELTTWKARVDGLVRDGKEVIVVFNNHPHGYAPKNALAFREMLGVPGPAGTPRLQDFAPSP